MARLSPSAPRTGLCMQGREVRQSLRDITGLVERLHSAPKHCHHSEHGKPPGQAQGPCRNPGFTYQTLPGIPLLPEAWAGALCREISGHRMVSDAELWPDLAARSQDSALVPKPSEGKGGNSAQRLQGGGAPGGRAGGQGPFLR